MYRYIPNSTVTPNVSAKVGYETKWETERNSNVSIETKLTAQKRERGTKEENAKQVSILTFPLH